LRGGA
jgi:hypothetical protein